MGKNSSHKIAYDFYIAYKLKSFARNSKRFNTLFRNVLLYCVYGEKKV